MSDRLQEIRARLDAATPGPWISQDEDVFIAEDDAHCFTMIARCQDDRREADADLIAHAPADIAWLLDEVEVLRNTKVSASNPLCDGSDDD